MYRIVPERVEIAAILGGNRYPVPFNWGIATPVCALARNDSINSVNNNLSSQQEISQSLLISPFYCTEPHVYYPQKPNRERLMTMYSMRYVQGHVQVYDKTGKFLFSADTEREAREELEDYAESAA